MSLPSKASVLAVLFAALLTSANLAQGGWNDLTQGKPAIDTFLARDINTAFPIAVCVQDSSGRLLAGSDALLVYDGITWKRNTFPGNHLITSITCDSNGTVWVGGYNEIGSFKEDRFGDYIYTSLSGALPANIRNFGTVWQVGLVGPNVVFFCDSMILLWDGVRFTNWQFPTRLRLFPVRSGNELWFTQIETGLYQFTSDGPHLEFPSSDLPPHVPFWIERKGLKVLLISRDGVFYAGQPAEALCSLRVIDFLKENPMSGAQMLADGSIALGTLEGIGIMTSDRQSVRIIRQEDGLLGNLVNSMFLDREQMLWISPSTGSGISRLDSSGNVSAFTNWSDNTRSAAMALVKSGNTIYAATDSGAYKLDVRPRKTSIFRRIPDLPSSGYSMHEWRDGFVCGSFGRIDYFDGVSTHEIFALPSTTFLGVAPSKVKQDSMYAIEGQRLVKLTKSNEDKWEHAVLCQLPDLCTELYVDTNDNIWLNSAARGILRFDSSKGKLATVFDGRSPDGQVTVSTIAGRNDKIFFSAGDRFFIGNAGDVSIKAIAGIPDALGYACSYSVDGRRL
ncbi:MAG TPA: two-component regulator propeller domain-containing protein, partial [Candidatus Didemnitutus sp.]